MISFEIAIVREQNCSFFLWQSFDNDMPQLYTDDVKTILQVRRNGVKNQIYELRTENNISQGALADKCKVSRQTINAIENNKYDPSLALAFRLAEVLGTTVDKLFLYKL